MRVFKFGGASVKDADGVRNEYDVLQKVGYDDVLIVVSAMGKTTNALEVVIKDYFDKIWKDYRGQNVQDLDFKRLEMFATNLIEEAVQVIAMVRKYQNSKENMK